MGEQDRKQSSSWRNDDASGGEGQWQLVEYQEQKLACDISHSMLRLHYCPYNLLQMVIDSAHLVLARNCVMLLVDLLFFTCLSWSSLSSSSSSMDCLLCQLNKSYNSFLLHHLLPHCYPDIKNGVDLRTKKKVIIISCSGDGMPDWPILRDNTSRGPIISKFRDRYRVRCGARINYSNWTQARWRNWTLSRQQPMI